MNADGLYLIDGISPFFRGYRKKKRVNWSKIPFDHWEKKGELRLKRLERMTEDFVLFCEQAQRMGYNAVSLDDLAHMLPHADYEPEVNEKLRICQGYYRRWIRIAKDHGLRVYITTDFLFSTPASLKQIGRSPERAMSWFSAHLSRFYESFPDVSGIILRIGEVDGKGVKGDFRSQIWIRTAGQARRLLQKLLPVCERFDRDLIFRLWTVGAYPVGDLLWNKDTFQKVFGKISSPSLVLSIKHGESDFFRHLPVNRHFFRSEHRKIVELQARREYEGCGKFPAFIGSELERIRYALKEARNMEGISVWGQTGGWTRFHHLLFLESSSVWNEINVWCCLRIFKLGENADQAVAAYAAEFLRPDQAEPLYLLLHLSESVVSLALYVDGFASRRLFFRRVRLPSTLHVYWDRILVIHPIRKVYRCLISDGETAVEQGRQALLEISEMRRLAALYDLPDEGLEFMADTFALLAAAREYYFLPYDADHVERMRAEAAEYKQKYKNRYALRVDNTPYRLRSRHLKIFLRLLLREQKGYRSFDYLFTLRLLSLLPALQKIGKGVVPENLQKQAMGLDTVFK